MHSCDSGCESVLEVFSKSVKGVRKMSRTPCASYVRA